MKVQIFALSALLVVAYVAAKCPEEDGEHVVYLSNPKDCSSFFQCSNGQAIFQKCAEGTQWNAELSVCDWAEEVGCVDREEEGDAPEKPPAGDSGKPPAGGDSGKPAGGASGKPPAGVAPVIPPPSSANFPRSN